MYDVEYPGTVIRRSSIHIFVFVEIVMTLKHLKKKCNRKRINISVTVVFESYVLLYYETKVYMLFINTIFLNQ